MPATQNEPLLAVLGRLLRELQRRYPAVAPINDWQEWTWPVEISGLPGAYEVTVMSRDADDTPFLYLTADPRFSAQTLRVTGPARVFVTGWDRDAGVPRTVGGRWMTDGGILE